MKAVWRTIRNDSWQYHAPGYAVFGTIGFIKKPVFGTKRPKNYTWSARVMNDCRIGFEPISGKASSLKKAKHIVEVLCKETDTLSRNDIE